MKRILPDIEVYVPYFSITIFLALVSTLIYFIVSVFPWVKEEIDFQLLVIGGLVFVAYYINRVAPKTAVPSFVWAIIAGIAFQPILSFYTVHIVSLRVVVEIFAAIILFAGGLEVPLKSFKRWFLPLASLSLVGVLSSAIIFSALLFIVLQFFGVFTLSIIPSVLVLSAALAATDPNAIIPTLKLMHFKRGFLKQLAISESGLSDISGTILTRFVIITLIGSELTRNSQSLLSYFTPLFNKSTYDALALQVISGIVVGYLGYLLIKKFYYKPLRDPTVQADPALLLSVPIFTFVLGNVVGGAGFLAAFVAGLFCDNSGHLRRVTHFYDSFLNHLIKPFIFIILGALVPLSTLLDFAPLGIFVSLIFMFVIRPLVVFISLFPWFFQEKFKLADLLFLSFIRETGIITAVLLIIATSYNFINSEFILSMGIWVIISTLVLEPPLTPYFARRVGVAD